MWLCSERTYCCMGRALFFFFSSRRRHTRLVSDWSSDVCSSDLFVIVEHLGAFQGGLGTRQDARRLRSSLVVRRQRLTDLSPVKIAHGADAASDVREIGRASCRESVHVSVVAVAAKKRNSKMTVK